MSENQENPFWDMPVLSPIQGEMEEHPILQVDY